MSRLTPKLAKSRSRLAGADRRPNDRSRIKAVPLASLSGPQRRLISALLEAAKAAAIRRAVGADTKTVEPGEMTGSHAGCARWRGSL